jgi:hypothetical protein
VFGGTSLNSRSIKQTGCSIPGAAFPILMDSLNIDNFILIQNAAHFTLQAEGSHYCPEL